MNLEFVNEDGQGGILDKSGTEFMDWKKKGDSFNTETYMALV
jgi:hypothetical protein